MTSNKIYDFDIVKPLETGWLGPMFHVRNGDKHFRLYNIQDQPSSLREDLRLRIQNMKMLEHPNFPVLAFCDENTLISSYYESITVEKLIQSGHHLSKESLRFLAMRILSLLEWAHDRDLIHGDLHPGLIYISHSGKIFIEGFGRIASRAEHPHTGHHRYLPPEPFGSIAGDVYAFGVILLELLLKRHISMGDILEKTHTQKVKDLLKECERRDPKILSLIGHVLQFHPSDRHIYRALSWEDASSFYNDWEEAYPLFPFANFQHDVSYQEPIDIIFHSEEFGSDIFLPTQEELDMNELTEDLLPPEPFEMTSKPPSIIAQKSSKKYFVAISILLLLFILLAIVL